MNDHSLIKSAHRIVIKIGSGLLTKDGGLNQKFFPQLAKALAHLRKQNKEVVLVSSGSIACGMDVLKLSRRPQKISQKQAAAALGQPLLMQHYTKAFSKQRINVAQVLLTREGLQNRRAFLNAKHALEELFQYQALPIINENDTVAVDEIQFGDNDQLSALVAHLIDADLLIILTDIDGLYEANPHRYPDAKKIHLVKKVTKKIMESAQGTMSQKSTGGMITKLLAAKLAASFGVPTYLAQGHDLGVLKKIFSGDEVGTLFLAQTEKRSCRKQWIASSLKPRGQIFIDAGAAAAILKNKKSLLPSGIVKVTGNFNIGDAVEIIHRGNKPIAQGLTSYSGLEIEKIKGAKSIQIESILGYRYEDEVVNRDDLVIL